MRAMLSARTWHGAAGLAFAMALCCGAVLLTGSSRGTEDLAFIPGELTGGRVCITQCRPESRWHARGDALTTLDQEILASCAVTPALCALPFVRGVITALSSCVFLSRGLP